MNQIWIASTESTNSYLQEAGDSVKPHTMVISSNQTHGRGQRGNSWESEPGKNLTFSFYIKPEGILPAEQFIISEAVALAIMAALREFGIVAKVKWPNDIYVDDKKICGILIENSILGPSIYKSIIGIGINVNQTLFRSDAPNPVSMAILLGKDYDLREVAQIIGRYLDSYIKLLDKPDALHFEYKKNLWRGDGNKYPFIETSSGNRFFAKIADVERTGHLYLQSDDKFSRYAFKEIIFVL